MSSKFLLLPDETWVGVALYAKVRPLGSRWNGDFWRAQAASLMQRVATFFNLLVIPFHIAFVKEPTVVVRCCLA